MYKKNKDRIYPQIGQIYIKPENPFGRAHFYSGEKKIGNNYFLPIYLIYWFSDFLYY